MNANTAIRLTWLQFVITLKADLVMKDCLREVIAAAGPVLRQTLVQYLGVQIHCVVQVYGVLVGLKTRH